MEGFLKPTEDTSRCGFQNSPQGLKKFPGPQNALIYWKDHLGFPKGNESDLFIYLFAYAGHSNAFRHHGWTHVTSVEFRKLPAGEQSRAPVPFRRHNREKNVDSLIHNFWYLLGVREQTPLGVDPHFYIFCGCFYVGTENRHCWLSINCHNEINMRLSRKTYDPSDAATLVKPVWLKYQTRVDLKTVNFLVFQQNLFILVEIFNALWFPN